MFDSCRGDLAIPQVVVLTRIPRQNRGLRPSGWADWRPRARQKGGLLQRILRRFCEVVVGYLQVVLRRDQDIVGVTGLSTLGSSQTRESQYGIQTMIPTNTHAKMNPVMSTRVGLGISISG